MQWNGCVFPVYLHFFHLLSNKLFSHKTNPPIHHTGWCEEDWKIGMEEEWTVRENTLYLLRSTFLMFFSLWREKSQKNLPHHYFHQLTTSTNPPHRMMWRRLEDRKVRRVDSEIERATLHYLLTNFERFARKFLNLSTTHPIYLSCTPLMEWR